MSTRNDILSILVENQGKQVSGEAIASQLGITRAAVCKNIKKLKEDGYEIQSSTNRGYLLVHMQDVLSADEIIKLLDKKTCDFSIYTYKTIDSTNLCAKRMALDGAVHGTTVISEEQTEGRGRRGRSFYSPKRSGIYLSTILRLDLNLLDSVLITTAASVAVSRAIQSVTGNPVQIKWVNDIYLDGKKICGILTEAVTDFESGSIDSIIVGIGINFCQAQDGFPDELKNVAGALYDQIPQTVTRNQLCAAVIHELLRICDSLTSRSFLKEYREKSLVLHKRIAVITNEGSRPAYVTDIDQNGGLIVQYENGEIGTLNSGEISIRPQP